MWNRRRRRNHLRLDQITRSVDWSFSRADRIYRRLLPDDLADLEWRQFAQPSDTTKARENRKRQGIALFRAELKVWAAVLLLAMLLGALAHRSLETMVQDGSRASAYWFTAMERHARYPRS